MDLFYQPTLNQHFLDGEEAKHCLKVFRYQVGDKILVTNGLGIIHEAVLSKIENGKAYYSTGDKINSPMRDYRVKIAVAPTRKAERNEWMVEKMTEMGIDEIHFFVSDHTHKESFKRVINPDRLERIVIAAMKQSGQGTKPSLCVHANLKELSQACTTSQQFIAYLTESPTPHLVKAINKKEDSLILIGPEGDFSTDEITYAISAGFTPVSLGSTRLRTETAAIAACHSVHLANEF